MRPAPIDGEESVDSNLAFLARTWDYSMRLSDDLRMEATTSELKSSFAAVLAPPVVNALLLLYISWMLPADVVYGKCILTDSECGDVACLNLPAAPFRLPRCQMNFLRRRR